MMQGTVMISWLNRALFFGAFLLLGIAVLEKLLNVAGYTLFRTFYTPGRLLEFAAMLLLFVIAMLLRAIRDELKSKN